MNTTFFFNKNLLLKKWNYLFILGRFSKFRFLNLKKKHSLNKLPISKFFCSNSFFNKLNISFLKSFNYFFFSNCFSFSFFNFSKIFFSFKIFFIFFKLTQFLHKNYLTSFFFRIYYNFF